MRSPTSEHRRATAATLISGAVIIIALGGILRAMSGQGDAASDMSATAYSPPLHTATTYLRDPDNQYRSGRGYIRADNPAYDQAEALLNHLELGAGAMLFSSGMAAATSVFLALNPGSHVVAPKVMYWGLRKWLQTFTKNWGLVVDFVDAEAVQKWPNPNVRIWQLRVFWDRESETKYPEYVVPSSTALLV